MKGEHRILLLCELLNVSRSGYYRWVENRPTKRQCEDVQLADQIVQAHQENRKVYGAPRIVEELRAKEVRTSKRRCARLMKMRGIRGRKKHRRRPRTTDSRHAHPPAPNLMRAAKPTGPNQVCMTDITYIDTGEGWLYLAVLLDLYSRAIVGWALRPTLETELVLAIAREYEQEAIYRIDADTLAVLGANLLLDLVNLWLDPRLRRSS
jgi:transposase InsO family protein